MKAVFFFAVIGSVVVWTPTWADFQLAPMRLDAGSAMQGSPGPIVLSSASPLPLQRQVKRQARRPAAPHGVAVAHGFGKEVPLAFATRQIVPAQVKVTFGPGVDRTALVDWEGGCPWIEALQSAVRPLGLRVAVHWMAVSITRA